MRACHFSIISFQNSIVIAFPSSLTKYIRFALGFNSRFHLFTALLIPSFLQYALFSNPRCGFSGSGFG